MYGTFKGPDGTAPPRLYPVGKEWAYEYLPPGSLTVQIRTYHNFKAALIAAIDVYCSYNTKWRLKNKARTYRQAAQLLGLTTEPPSKAKALRQLREGRYREKKDRRYLPPF